MKDQIEKQAIEEMAKVIERTEQIARDAHCGLPSPTMYAKDLYWHGYRRQIEGGWQTIHTPLYQPIYFKCSVCGVVQKTKTKHCPECGAKMKDGEGGCLMRICKCLEDKENSDSEKGGAE